MRGNGRGPGGAFALRRPKKMVYTSRNTKAETISGKAVRGDGKIVDMAVAPCNNSI